MKKSKKLLKKGAAITLAAAMTIGGTTVAAFGYGEVNYTTNPSTFYSDTDSSSGFSTFRTAWDAGLSSNSGAIALTPGKDETCLNFAWYSETKGTPAVKVYEYGKQSSAKIVKGTATDIDEENWQGKTYEASNKVSIENYFKENTEYRYVYTDNYVEGGTTNWSDEYSYTTGDSDSFSVILTGDPQIGASTSSNDKTATDESAARDTYNWNLTVTQALETDPDASFLLSAGDQIDTPSTDADSKKTRQSEYAGYLYPSVFRSLPIATTIGNHDMSDADYTEHFNNPNSSDNLGATVAGCDYYFSYGDVLFISLNSNNRNYTEHETLMKKAVASNPDAKWKVVIFHSDIYGSGQPHSDTDASANRVIFAPLMDEFDIDICLTGHDHTYSRSYQIIDGNVVDYDLSDNSVTDPEGTLYITTGSGSGSKCYNLLSYTPYYIAERTNAWLPSFSTIDFSDDELTIKTYDYTGAKYADDFTIKKTDTDESADEILEEAESVDTTKYEATSVNTFTTAVTALKNLVEKYETAEDTGFTKIVSTYGTSEDIVKGYGSVANSSDKDTATHTLTAGGNNRFYKGFSTLLDKTIYTQLDGGTVSVIDSTELTEAKQEVLSAMSNLKLKETTTADNSTDKTTADNSTDKTTEQDVKTGFKNAWVALVIALISAIAGIAVTFLSRKDSNCEEK